MCNIGKNQWEINSFMSAKSDDYWSTEIIDRFTEGSYFSKFRKHSLIRYLFKSRCANEKYIAMHIKQRLKILDIACGAGNEFLAKKGIVYGVDIQGCPLGIPKSKGYKDARYWLDNFELPFGESFDLIFCSNLNAHVDFDTFKKMISACLPELKTGGAVLFINEYETKNILERVMKSFPEKYTRYKVNAHHNFLTTQIEFLDRVSEIDDLSLIHSSRLSMFQPFIHFLWWNNPNKLPSKGSKFLCILFDIVFSFLEVFIPKQDGFLVGHYLVKK